MSTRTSSAAALLLLAACGQGSAVAPRAEPNPDDLIECAVGGAAAFVRECAVEQADEDGTPILIVRHPDGAFRRFVVTDDGYGIATADGVERAAITLHGKAIEVAVGTDRYRLPARVAGDERR